MADWFTDNAPKTQPQGWDWFAHNAPSSAKTIASSSTRDWRDELLDMVNPDASTVGNSVGNVVKGAAHSLGSMILHPVDTITSNLDLAGKALTGGADVNGLPNPQSIQPFLGQAQHVADNPAYALGEIAGPALLGKFAGPVAEAVGKTPLGIASAGARILGLPHASAFIALAKALKSVAETDEKSPATPTPEPQAAATPQAAPTPAPQPAAPVTPPDATPEAAPAPEADLQSKQLKVLDGVAQGQKFKNFASVPDDSKQLFVNLARRVAPELFGGSPAAPAPAAAPAPNVIPPVQTNFTGPVQPPLRTPTVADYMPKLSDADQADIAADAARHKDLLDRVEAMRAEAEKAKSGIPSTSTEAFEGDKGGTPSPQEMANRERIVSATAQWLDDAGYDHDQLEKVADNPSALRNIEDFARTISRQGKNYKFDSKGLTMDMILDRLKKMQRGEPLPTPTRDITDLPNSLQLQQLKKQGLLGDAKSLADLMNQ